jgi:hypothetical protein
VIEIEDVPDERRKKKPRTMGEVQPTLLVIVTMKIVNGPQMRRKAASVPRLRDGGEGVGRAAAVVTITIPHCAVRRSILIDQDDIVGEDDRGAAEAKEGVGVKRAVGAEAGRVTPLIRTTILVNVGVIVDVNANGVIREGNDVRRRGAVVEIDRIAHEMILLVTFRVVRELILERIIEL